LSQVGVSVRFRAAATRAHGTLADASLPRGINKPLKKRIRPTGNWFGKLRGVADVFLSYAEQDGKVGDQIVAALLLSGITVAPAHPPQPPIGLKTVARELTFAKCVVVLWSEHSVTSELVRAEADYAKSRDILVSAGIGKPPPLGFRGARFANLTHWTGEATSDVFLDLKRLVEARLNPPRTLSSTARSRASDVPSIFLCYRREDTQDAAGRLHDRLVDAYGLERVFMDIDSVPPGVNFVTYINQQLQGCAAVLVMIGRGWTAMTDPEGNRRLDDPADHVRVEVATALKQGVLVIPILVQNASMPRAADLPEDIRDVAFHNAMKLTPEFWRAGVERLITELDRVMKG
jgi:hypothetical protein